MPAVPCLALPAISVNVDLLSSSRITRKLEPIRLQHWFPGLFVHALSERDIAIFDAGITSKYHIILRDTHVIILVVIHDVIIVGGLNGGGHCFQQGFGE